ncbi:hypothetical protein HYC85_026027 [Camellia sinensis]|uniref:Uncharacterized protein n=1 Tax=Camellia sinensis TaxID=4442 RepID=A0A7J7G5N1_CAMSI|nr:hypothetical protein HYC85_026027 [Camellia sinensis]
MILNSVPELLFVERFQSINYLLSLVRFPLLPYALLKNLERSDLSRKIPTFDFLVKEAICYLEFGLANPQGDHNARFQHRRSSFKELQYICDGDSNGVLYFIGTSFGEHQWVNPVLAKRICVSASSPISRHTDPKVLVSRTYQGTSFAGPRIEDGKNCTWWIIDIGQELISSSEDCPWNFCICFLELYGYFH